jgi:predicted MPP superfamily phosphohydrolase
MRHLVSVVGGLQYDICVLTGDYRGKTYGPFEKCLEIIDELQAQLKGPVYGVLGNHGSIRMAPSLEAMGICMLFNECEPIVRNGQCIFLAGVDDPHFYRADDMEKAASQIPSDAFSILLAHTPEVYDRAMSARFDLMSDTPTEASFAYPAEFPSSWRQHYLDSWARDHGAMAPWSGIPRWALAPAFCRSV